MNVAALQKHLTDLAEFVAQAGGSKSVLDELRATSKALEPFAAYRFADFAAFLELALRVSDEFKRTGQVPIPAGKGKRATGGTAKQAAADEPLVNEAKQKVRRIYEEAPMPGFLVDRAWGELTALAARPEVTLTVLKTAAAEAHAGGKVKTMRSKDKIRDEIWKSILLRKGTPERVNQ